MVEGFPVSGRQLLTRVGDFFRVARTEVMQVPVWQDSHVTPPRSTTRSTGSPDGALGHLALGDGSLGSHGSSPPQVGSHGTPASFAPPPPGREGSLLSADVLQRMHALEQRAPHLYGQPFDRPQSRSNSFSLPQEAIQGQLAGFDQRAQAQELEIQRLRRQLEEAARREREQAVREQALREATLANQVPQVAGPAQHQNPVPTQVVPPKEIQVPPQVTHQVDDMAAHAVEAFRAPAQSAASAGRGLLSSLWSGIGGLQEGLARSITPPGGMDISYWDPCMVAQFRQPHPGGMGLCQQVSPLRCPGPRFLRFPRLMRHQAQALKVHLQECQPCLGYLLLQVTLSLMLCL